MAKKADILYIKSMREWVKEQKAREDDLLNCIAVANRIAASNRAQLKLHRERVELGMREYRAWAKKNPSAPKI
jgi:hypothetical protein